MKQLATVKIPIHSLIDLITNSSTEIFVHSSASIEPAKAILNELLKLSGSQETCDDVFEISLEYSEYETYEDDEEDDDNEVNENDEKETYDTESYLLIKSKDPKYNLIVEQLKTFLYSPDWYEHSN